MSNMPTDNTMSPEQALNILDQVASIAQLTRADHVRAQTAVRTLAQIIRPAEYPTIPAEPPKKNEGNK